MNNKELITSKASKALKSKDYKSALSDYIKLSKIIGEKFYQYNINLCRKMITTLDLDGLKEFSNDFLDDSDKKNNEWDIIFNKAQKIPSLSGKVRHFNKFKLRIGVITDEFMYNYYSAAIDDFIPITPDNYNEVLANGLDAFMFISCWFGLSKNEWRGVSFDEKLHDVIDRIVNHCKRNNIKTIFQTIEDPSNYHKFLSIAKKFDCIFTTDADIIPNYKKDCGHDNVYYGEYGFNPLFNNPIGSSRPRLNAAFFAGSYPRRYKERCQDMELMFDSVIEKNIKLVVADRNFESDDSNIKFPSKYHSMVVDKFDHRVLQNVHKLFRFNLNLNSIKESSTMCAMRVYELQAQGELLLSNYAKSLALKFPNLKIINSSIDIDGVFDESYKKYFEEKYSRAEIIRKMYADKSVFDQTRKLLTTAGFGEDKFGWKIPKIFVLYGDLTEKIKNNFEVQSYGNKVLMSIEDFDALSKDEIRDDYFTFFSDSFEYTGHYIEDQINCFKFTNSKFVTKLSTFHLGIYKNDVQNEMTNRIDSVDVTVFSSEVLDKYTACDLKSSKAPFLLEYGYANNPFQLSKFDASTIGLVTDCKNNESKSIYFLYSNKWRISASWSGASVNVINEMYLLSSAYDIYYNDIYVNDLFDAHGIFDEDAFLVRYSKYVQEVDPIYSEFLPKILKPSRLYYASFYRAGNDVNQTKFYLNELAEPKIYSHNFNDEIWGANIVGFQNETSRYYALTGGLKKLGDDGTLSYSSINNPPKRTFVRLQSCVREPDVKSAGFEDFVNNSFRLNFNSKFVIGVSGTITEHTSPLSLIAVIDKLRVSYPELNVVLVIYSLNILIDLPKRDWIKILTYSKDQQDEALGAVDVLFNTWHQESQHYSASNKILEAMSYGIPIISPKTDARVEQLGNDYPLFHKFESTIRYLSQETEREIYCLIEKCLDRTYRMSISNMLLSRANLFSKANIEKFYTAQLRCAHAIRILIVNHSLNVGGVEQYTIDIVNSLKDCNIFIYSHLPISDSRVKQLEEIAAVNFTNDFNGCYDYVFLNSFPTAQDELVDCISRLKKSNANVKLIPITHTDIHEFTKNIVGCFDDFYRHITVANVITNKINVALGGGVQEKTVLITPCVSPVQISKSNDLNARFSNHIAYFGRVVPIKGVLQLIRYFAAYVCKHPNSNLSLGIYGPFVSAYYFQLCKDVVDKSQLSDRIVIHNRTFTSDERSEILNRTDYLVYATTMDGLPYTFLEAMLTGTPVISTPVGGIPHLIEHNKNGFLLDFPDLYVADFNEEKPYDYLVQKINSNECVNYELFEKVLNVAYSDFHSYKKMVDIAKMTVRKRFGLVDFSRRIRSIVYS